MLSLIHISSRKFIAETITLRELPTAQPVPMLLSLIHIYMCIRDSSVADLINRTQNLDCYEFYPGVEDDETLGRIYVEDMEAIDVPEPVSYTHLDVYKRQRL